MTLASRPIAPGRFRPVIPGDKSITHRAYLLGAMAEGETRVSNPNRGADCAATLAAIRALGAGVRDDGETVVVTGTGGRFRVPGADLDLGNSGTGFRLLCGVLAGSDIAAVLTGDASLRTRPMERVLEPLRSMGARAASSDDRAPVRIDGAPLQPITYRLPVASAQVKSAILLAGCRAPGRTRVEGGAGTRDHTERLLAAFGAAVQTGPGWATVDGPAALRGTALTVPGDPSAATFYFQWALTVPGATLELAGVSANSTRTSHFELFSRMGLDLQLSAPTDAPEPAWDLRAAAERAVGIEVEPDAVPGAIDELPALAAAGAFAHGTTRVRGAGELRYKESDRLATVAEALLAIGADIRTYDDGWEIVGSAGRRLRGGTIRARGDHRVAMALLVAGLACEQGVRIADEPGIGTSDPHFEDTLRRAGAFEENVNDAP